MRFCYLANRVLPGLAGILFLLLLGPAGADAQRFYLRSHDQEEILHQARISVIYQARKGYLWVGSDRGLYRYDGFAYKPYPLPGRPEQPRVTAIYESKKQELWIGYADGSVGILQYNKLSAWLPEEGLPKVAVTGFAEDGQGQLWISTYGEGMYVLAGRHLYQLDDKDGLSSREIYAAAADPQGRIWAATDQGIWFCTFEAGRKQAVPAPVAAGFPADIVRSLVPDPEGNIWLGLYDRSPMKYHARKRIVRPVSPDWQLGTVIAIEPASAKELWVATESRGLVRFTKQTGEDWKEEHFLPDLSKARISALHADLEMNLWIGSASGGLQSANLLFSFLEGSPLNAQAVLRVSDGSFLAGTEKGLIGYRPGEKQRTFKDIPPALNIASLAEDRFGNIWIGAFGDYVYIHNLRSRKTRRLTAKEGLINGSILSMYRQGDRIWMATLGGVFRIDMQGDPLAGGALSVTNLHAEQVLGTNFIYQVTGDERGNVWFATDGNGIASLNGSQIRHYPAALSPETKTVYSLCVTGDGHVWMGTARHGLYEFDGRKLISHNVEGGLRNTTITSVVADRSGRILVLHPEGIDLYDPRSRRFSYYDQESGVGKINPNINAFAKDSSGIWLGSANGLIRYHNLPPAYDLPVKPGIGLLDVLVMQESVLGSGDTLFSHDQNYIAFRYQGSWYSNPSLIRYRYRMIGLDKDWKYTREMEISYSNLPAGHYTFIVEAAINNNFNDSESLRFSFRIRPPIYATQGFIAALLIVLGAAFYFWIRHRERQAARLAERNRERVEFQFNSLKNQVNPHFLFNSFNTLIALIEENPDAAVQYVENLSDFYRSILQYGETDLIPLEEELELVRHFVFLLQHRYGRNLKVSIDIADHSGFVPPLALQMLVENAIKHNVISSARPLLVTIRDQADELIVYNSLQRKQHPERSTGIGLQNIINRYRLLDQGRVAVTETDGGFEVSIPRIRRQDSAHLTLFA